jgi:hypothetical protein
VSGAWGAISEFLGEVGSVRNEYEASSAGQAWELLSRRRINTIFLSPYEFRIDSYAAADVDDMPQVRSFVEEVRRRHPAIAFVLVFASEESKQQFLKSSGGRFDHYLTLMRRSVDKDCAELLSKITLWHQTQQRTREVERDHDAPSWVQRWGMIFGAATLLFFMVLVLISVTGKQVPAQSRFIVVIVLAIGAALSVGFMGGSAAADGKLALPLFKDHPLSFAVSGGIATLVIMLVLGNALFGH